MMRKFAAVAMAALLAACQTVPPQTGFSPRQAAALEEAGFHREGENYELGLSDKVLFEFDKSDLTGEATQVIDHLAAVFTSVDIHGAGVQGHTDALGSYEYNQKLSERRALAVRGELVRAGLIPAEVRAQGFGETRPVASNETDEGRAQNRRVVIVVTPADAIPLTN